jgi:adenosine kinase
LSQADIASRLEALVITRGGDGSDIYAGGEHYRIPAVKAENIVDPTGCGDAYRAGLLYGITEGFDWPTTGRIASLLGAIKIASQGGQNHAFTPQEIEQKFEAAFGYKLR